MTARQRIHDALERFTGRIYDRAGLTIAGVLLCVATLATWIPEIRFETRVEEFLHADDPLRVAYDAFREEFGRDDLVLLTIETQDLFSAEGLERLRALHRELEARVPHVEEITSLVNARETRGERDELIVGELLEDWPETDAERAAARSRALDSPLYESLLISPDASLTAVMIEPRRVMPEQDVDALLAGFEDPGPEIEADAGGGDGRAGLDGAGNAALLDAVREVAARHQAPGFRIHVTGTASLSQYLQESMQRDMGRFTLLAIASIALFLGALFRSAAGVLLPLLVVVVSLVATLALMAIVGVPISLPVQILPSFLLAVGVGGAVHLLAIFFQRRRAGEAKREAIVHAVGHSGLAIIMTSLTTAGAMASFATAELAPVAGLGLCAPGGVLVALVLTLVLLPALIAAFPVRGGASVGSGRSFTQRLLVRCGELAVDHRAAVLVVSAALLAAAGVGMLGLEFSHAPMKWFPPDNPFRVATELTDERMGGSVNLEVLVDTKTPDGMQEPEALRRIDAAQSRLDGFDYEGIRVGKSLSLADTVKEIHQALNENRADFYAIPGDGRLVAQELLLFENAGSDDLEDVVDPRFQIGRITLRAPFGDAVAYVPFLERVADVFREQLGDEADVRFTGLLPIISGTMRAMMRSMAMSYVIAFGVISLLLVLLIGNLRLGLAAMVPNAAPIVVVLGAMGYLGLPLDTFTMLIGSIAIGLAVDDTIHFMHNFRGYLERTGDPRRAVAETLATAGQAMLFTTLVLSTGFAIYAFSSMTVLAAFGLLTASAVALALLADVLLAPALMTWIVEEKR